MEGMAANYGKQLVRVVARGLGRGIFALAHYSAERESCQRCQVCA